MYKSNFDYDEVMRRYKNCQKIIHNFVSFAESTDSTVNQMDRGKVEINLKAVIGTMEFCTSCVEYTSLNKMLALCYFMDKRDVQGIYHLVESHAVLLHLQVQHRFNKTEERQALLDEPQVFGLNASHIKFNVESNPENGARVLQAKLAELPEEWCIVQLTTQYEPKHSPINNKSEITSMVPMHMSILPTGKKAIPPFCITMPKPQTSSHFDGCKEIHELLSSNKLDLAAQYANNSLYWKMREKQNTRMKAAIRGLESTLLKEWRILLMADPIDTLDLVTEARAMIDKLIADNKSTVHVSETIRWLLYKIVLGACFLTRDEIALAVKHILPLDDKFADNVIFSIYGKLSYLLPLATAKRKTLVLIVDENLDHIPFETMEILQSHPVTRFPSLQMAYALFKEYENTIEDGCKIVNVDKDIGSFIVNPAGNLPKMQKRMRTFIEYWLSHWMGSYNTEPDEKTFESALTKYDILMYNGHGSGIQYLSGEKIEKLRVKAIVLLFGCNSARLLSVGGKFPPIGVSNQYLIACSPCVLGMLWEVTDGDVDKITANFLGNWIPSPARRPWSEVNIEKWMDGTLEFKKSKVENSTSMSFLNTETCDTLTEPEMLRAVAMSRRTSSQFMTGAAVVVRGLPIKLKKI